MNIIVPVLPKVTVTIGPNGPDQRYVGPCICVLDVNTERYVKLQSSLNFDYA